MAPVNVLLSGLPFGSSTLCLAVGDESHTLHADTVADAVVAATGLPRASFYLRTHDALLHPCAPLTTPGQHTAFVSLCLRRALPGGKGGFGAMLRGAAASKKTTNFDACRDLHGRRLRHVRDEAAVRRFLQTRRDNPPAAAPAPAPPSPAPPAKRAREPASLPPRVDPDDVEDDIHRIRGTVADAVADAVAQGGRARRKRRRTEEPPEPEPERPPVRPCDWMVDYDGVSSSDSEAGSREPVEYGRPGAASSLVGGAPPVAAAALARR